MDSFLVRLRGGADGEENNTICALVWSQHDPAVHSPPFSPTWKCAANQERFKSLIWRHPSVLAVFTVCGCRSCAAITFVYIQGLIALPSYPPLSQVCCVS